MKKLINSGAFSVVAILAFVAAITVVARDNIGFQQAWGAEVTPVAASVIPGDGAKTQEMYCGGTITAGMPVYVEASTNKIKMANQGSLETASVAGFATGGCSAGGKTLVDYSDTNFTTGTTMVVGAAYCLGLTASGGVVECMTGFAATTPGTGTGKYFVPLYVAKTTTTAKLIHFGSAPPAAY